LAINTTISCNLFLDITTIWCYILKYDKLLGGKNMDWLKEYRNHTGMSGAAVARAVGIAPQYYNFIESGKRRPSVDAAKRIAKVLGFDWTEFFE
jgi:DNA-binding XRE family transcriptional regulator